MKDNPSPAMLPVLITKANKSLEKVNLLIDDLLNKSKANAGQLQVRHQKFKILKAIRDCCESLLNGTNFRFRIDGDDALEVYADVIRIEQVVTNFVSNAMKYAPNSKEIDIIVSNSAGMVKVSINDKGAGIPAANLGSLFDRYYRVDHSGKEYTGLGLGLYICSEIIKRHHGTIGVDSEIGVGSSFWFKLPVS